MRDIIGQIRSRGCWLYMLLVVQWLAYWIVTVWVPTSVEAVAYQRF